MAESQSQNQGDNPFNGLDADGNLWVFGKMAIVKNRKPRTTKAGSLSSVHTRQVTGDLRDEGGGVGGTVNTHHQGGTENRTVENKLVNKGK